jgi:hypothetical protein
MTLAALIISPVAALLGTFGGLFISQRHARWLAADAHAWETRREARNVSSRLVLAATRLSLKLAMLVQIAAAIHSTGPDRNKLLETFLDETSDFESDTAELSAALVEFQLSFADHELLELAKEVGIMSDQLGIQLPAYVGALAGGSDVQVEADAIMAKVKKLATALGAFHAGAFRQLAEPLHAVGPAPKGRPVAS